MVDTRDPKSESQTPAPPMPQAAIQRPGTERVASVDTLRGLTILLMVFVNDLGAAAPSWMHHIQPPNADGMTLADLVFPAFLFIVGISIPLATERALQRGKTRSQILLHIVTRTLGLLIMGLIGINQRADITLGAPLWGLLAYSSILLAWCVVPKERGVRRNIFIGLKCAGVCALLTLLAIFRREPVVTEVLYIAGPVENWIWLRTQWWGILGLIGWAYLTGSVLYLLLRTRREWLMGAMLLLLVNYLALSDGGLFARVSDKAWLNSIRPFIEVLEAVVGFVDSYVGIRSGLGSLAAIVVGGSILGTTLTGPLNLVEHKPRLKWAAMFVLGLFISGLVFDTFAGVNKIAATPTWSLWCAALTCALWMITYQVMDVGGFQKWAIVARPAGANPLIAYLLHPILIALISLAGLWNQLVGYKSSPTAAVVICGSMAMAFGVAALTGVIAKLGLRLRL